MTNQDLIKLVLKPESQEFIAENEGLDIIKLFFKYAREPGKKALLSQMELRRKLQKKLPEWVANPWVVLPLGVSAEQASSEGTAKLKAGLIQGEEFLDITGGLGVDTFYLSRSFQNTVYTEKQEDLVVLAEHNFTQLGAKIEVFHQDGIEKLKQSNADFVYADPARRGNKNEKLIRLEEYEPNLIPHLQNLIKDGRRSLVKTSPMLDISQALKELKYVSEVWVISHRNECKEVLYLLRKDASLLTCKTFNLSADHSVEEFFFNPQNPPETEFASEIGDYLYEPNASILKAQGTDHLSKSYRAVKLHPNSNLLTDDRRLTSFPGKAFAVKDKLKPYDRSLKKRRFNVISRNYPDNAEIIQKRLQLTPAKEDFLIATRVASGQYYFIVAQLIY